MHELDSPALYRAILKSESFRIIGVSVVLAVLVVYTILRGLQVNGFSLLWAQTAVLAIIIAHELLTLRAVKRSLNDGKEC